MTDIGTAPASAPSEPLPPENFPLAIAAGIGAAVAGAVIWAVVTVVTQMELGIIAVAIGYVVGQAIRATGHGRSQMFGILGAVCGLLGCLAGNLLSDLAFYAQAMHITYMDTFGRLSVPLIQGLFTARFSPMDLIFYAIAVYEGYRFSFHR